MSIQRSFSKASQTYDKKASMPRAIGQELLEIIPDLDPRKILDVGTGTGWMIEQMIDKFPQSEIYGVDFAKGMIDQIKKKDLKCQAIVADARNLPFDHNMFDLIVSNATYQWIEDLEPAFLNAFQVLKEQGVFVFSCFSEGTYRELFTCLEKSLNGRLNGEPLPIQKLPSEENLLKVLKVCGFKQIKSRQVSYTKEYEDMFDLLHWLKSIGANRLKRDFFVGKNALKRANRFYKEEFKSGSGVKASFEGVIIKGIK